MGGRNGKRHDSHLIVNWEIGGKWSVTTFDAARHRRKSDPTSTGFMYERTDLKLTIPSHLMSRNSGSASCAFKHSEGCFQLREDIIYIVLHDYFDSRVKLDWGWIVLLLVVL